LGSHLQALVNNIIMENRPKRSDSPKFTEEYRPRSPIKSNLYKYEVEQDYIEDSSPIKNKFSEYRPVDHKTNKYFTLDEEEEDYDRKRQREKSISNTNNNNYRPARNPSDRDKPTPTRFNNP